MQRGLGGSPHERLHQEGIPRWSPLKRGTLRLRSLPNKCNNRYTIFLVLGSREQGAGKREEKTDKKSCVFH
ncbi:hypothetical protein BJP34_21135 [Moorena producens PAL-8-15-08-1]|uniref:Uncharacterized protein n=1 Tax=Moorena producens PAL-8-15-08-1 TaxID=1458985 RepID=A0A1D8TVD1_9CYAN|nr:hypothetical protein BJP34_21135 [Moorena producens PAL-8-15-08-1]